MQAHLAYAAYNFTLPHCRLAYPGLWWRVTMVALIVCASNGNIGCVVWKEHHTLRALMKMLTSMRFRFPTIDCDDESREETKKAEQAARDEVRVFVVFRI
jgi:hypothetical protein